MDGLMMDYPLLVRHVAERAETVFPDRELVARTKDGTERSTYGQLADRVRRLAGSLERIGVQPGDRVATFAWNSIRHLELYLAVPSMGAVLHTLNIRLFEEDLRYIVGHAEDKVIFVDASLAGVMPTFEGVEREILMPDAPGTRDGALDYEQLVADGDEGFAFPDDLDERTAAALCYTSGTTGKPKGVLYSHRAIVLHSLVSAMPDAFGLGQHDVVMPVVPMFHVNAWGLPFTSVAVGAGLVFPGPHLDAASLLDLAAAEHVTFTAGVPTVWHAVLDALDREPSRWDLGSLTTLVVGGSAMPQSSIEAFEKRHGLEIVHAWGMTELAPIGTISRLKPHMESAPEAERLRARGTQGLPAPLIEVRAIGEDGPVPADGKTMGELQVRGPWVASGYLNQPCGPDKFTEDGWFRTGDVVTFDPEGYMRIADRKKDLIKSGGEWISSVDLENALAAHPAVKEAAVVAVSHPKWDERPVACVVLKEGAVADESALRAHLAVSFAKFWLPDAFFFLEQIPRTATGKYLKSALRDQLKDVKL
ncbi:MAG: long-chain fatty acid--CoA ligase [Myxococcales bacterium]